MTIREYERENPDWDIYMECELEFAEPENSKEAEINLQYVIDNYCDLQTLAIVVNSYYNGTIEWERF